MNGFNSFEHDIFFSYDFVDDEVAGGSEGGLITCFHDHLLTKLRQRLGRAPSIFFRDRKIPSGSDLGTGLRDAVRGSAVLIVFHSVSYEGSDWCKSELQEFCDAYPAFDGRLFVISLSPEHLPEKSDLFSVCLPPYRRLYYRKQGELFRLPPNDPRQENIDNFTLEQEAGRLAKHITSKLNELAARPDPKASVFLGCVSEDTLKACTYDIAKHLEQNQIRVVRSSPWVEEDALRHARMEEAVGRCNLFVGVVDHGNVSSTAPEAIHSAEQRALIADLENGPALPSLLWMAKDLSGYSEEELQKLRSQANVVRDQLQSFKRQVLARIFSEQQRETLVKAGQNGSGKDKKFFLVVAAEADREQARVITAEITERGMGRDVDLDPNDDPGEVRSSGEQWRTNLKQLVKAYEPAALLFVDGSCPGAWIDDRLRACVLLQGDFTVDPEIGVCEFPPVPKSDRDCRPEDRVRFFSLEQLDRELDRLVNS